MQWYYQSEDGSESGPHDVDELKLFAASMVITPETRIRREDWQEHKPASAFKELVAAFADDEVSMMSPSRRPHARPMEQRKERPAPVPVTPERGWVLVAAWTAAISAIIIGVLWIVGGVRMAMDDPSEIARAAAVLAILGGVATVAASFMVGGVVSILIGIEQRSGR